MSVYGVATIDQNAHKALSDNLNNLSDGDRAFAASLLASKTLSSKQHYWIEKLAARATGAEPAPPAPQKVENISGVIALFAATRKPIRLALDDGRPLALSICGQNSKHTGSVNVTDGGPFGSNIWYGRISPAGQYQPSRASDASVAAMLAALSSDPAGVAAKYGKLTGCCCFCDADLTDERSKLVGYGPVCAKKRGLPWGAKA